MYSCNALSARFFDVYRALNSYFMIMIMITFELRTFFSADSKFVECFKRLLHRMQIRETILVIRLIS